MGVTCAFLCKHFPAAPGPYSCVNSFVRRFAVGSCDRDCECHRPASSPPTSGCRVESSSGCTNNSLQKGIWSLAPAAAQESPVAAFPKRLFCGFLLPIAYIGWLILNNKKDYLGDNMPTGTRAIAYNAAMVTCVLVVLASVAYSTLVGLSMLS